MEVIIRKIHPFRLTLALWVVMLVPTTTQAVADEAWVPIGPEGGVISNVVQHPTQTQVLYIIVGVYQPSLYKSTDGGMVWNKLYVFSRQITTLAVNPKNANELYAGASGPFLKSTDGGTTWNTASTVTGDFREVIPDSADSNVLHACGSSYPKGQKENYSLTYFKSTDRGSTWSVMSASTVKGSGTALCFDPQNPNLVFVGGYGADKATVQLFKTTDGGATWSDAAGSISGTVSDILLHSGSEMRIYAATSAGVYRSTDAGTTWTKNNGFIGGDVLALDKKNHILYLGAIRQVYRSIDGGANWMYHSYENASAGFTNAILVDPSQPSTVFAGSNGGFFRSTDSGLSWSESNAGIMATNITAIASEPGSPEVLFAAQESGYVYKTQNALAKPSAPQSVAWQKFYQIPNCNSFGVKTILFDPSRPNTMYLYKEYG